MKISSKLDLRRPWDVGEDLGNIRMRGQGKHGSSGCHGGEGRDGRGRGTADGHDGDGGHEGSGGAGRRHETSGEKYKLINISYGLNKNMFASRWLNYFRLTIWVVH